MNEYVLEWRCDDSDIASIDSDQKLPIYDSWHQITGYNYVRGGNLTAKNPGTTRVICTYKGLSAVCQLVVNPIYVSEVNFENNEYEMTPYQSLQLEASVLPVNATYKKLVWKSANTTVAVVDNTGKVVALNKGKTLITATVTDGSMAMGSCLISVNPEEKEDIDIDFSIDDYVQFSTKVENGSPFTLSVKSPTPNWNIKSFYINGVSALIQLVNGVYSVDCVDNHMSIEANFEYDGQLQFYDLTLGVESIVDNTIIRVSKTESQLCITNVKNGTIVKIYSVGGSFIGSHECSGDSLKIDLAPNYYVIFVDNVCFKIKI